MKSLNSTEKLINELVQEKSIESYAIVIGYGEDEWVFSSPKVNMDTYFDAASVGKIFPTTTLALIAIDRGLLSLDDTLEKFFPGVPEDKKSITVKQLLTHTSGMLRREFPENVAERGRESIAEFILGVPLSYEPGTHYAYCCTGMVLMGFIVEKIFGMGLDEALEEYIKKPLGLTRSKYNISINEPNAALCNTDPNVFDCRYDDHNVTMMQGIPAGPGGNFITAGDMRKFVKALVEKDPRLFSEKTFALAEQNYTGGLPVLDIHRGFENHGLGFTYVNENCSQARDLFPEGSIGHDGSTGQSFYLNHDMKLYVIFLSNASRCDAIKLGRHSYDYNAVCEMRAKLHRAIKSDLGI